MDRRKPSRERNLIPYIPNQGDIVWLDFTPSSGKEIFKRRPAFVISPKQFNQHTDMSIVAPITSTIRNTRLEVVLPNDLTTKGAILVYQLKSLDFIERNMTFIEAAPSSIIQEVCTIAQLIIQSSN